MSPRLRRYSIHCGRHDLCRINTDNSLGASSTDRVSRSLLLQVTGIVHDQRAVIESVVDLSGGDWFESSRRSFPQIMSLLRSLKDQDTTLAGRSLSGGSPGRLGGAAAGQESVQAVFWVLNTLAWPSWSAILHVDSSPSSSRVAQVCGTRGDHAVTMARRGVVARVRGGVRAECLIRRWCLLDR
jgi:hypothetical protein